MSLPAEEVTVVRGVFERFAEIIPARLDPGLGIRLLGEIDERASGTRMFFSVPTSNPNDRLVIYKKAREKEALEFHFVPEFSFEGGKSSRRTAFKDYIQGRRDAVDGFFGLDLQLTKPMAGRMDQLVITAQAWKGFFYRITRPLSEWPGSDFVT